jgi:hypothetical protein
VIGGQRNKTNTVHLLSTATQQYTTERDPLKKRGEHGKSLRYSAVVGFAAFAPLLAQKLHRYTVSAVLLFSAVTFDVDVNRVLASLPQDGVAVQLDRAHPRQPSGGFYGGLGVEVVAGQVQGLQYSVRVDVYAGIQVREGWSEE